MRLFTGPDVRGGDSVVEWDRDDAGNDRLLLITPGMPYEIETVPFTCRTCLGGAEFVLSDDGRHLALFVYSGQSSQGYELFTLEPRFAHIGGVAETLGQGTAPVFSPGGRWVAMYMTGGYPVVRESDVPFEEVQNPGSDARTVTDWAALFLTHLPDLTTYRVAVGVDLPLSTDVDDVDEWDTYHAVRFTGDEEVILTMPWQDEVRVPLPPPANVTAHYP